jgi:hypothetical protein
MKPVDFRPEQLQAWLSGAPRQLLLLLIKRLLEGDPSLFRQALHDAWEHFLRSPDRRQHADILDAVADALRRHFQLAEPAPARLALELVGSEVDPADQAAREDSPLPAPQWQRVRDAVLSVDVLYQAAGPGSGSAWRRQTRVFLRDEAGAVRNISQEVDLRWDDLPGDVREACLKQGQTQQRFVLYRGGAAHPEPKP